MTDPVNFTPSQLRRIAGILESNDDQPGFDFWSAVAASEADDMAGPDNSTAPFQTYMTDLCRIGSISVRSGFEIAETYSDRMFITIPDRALVLEDSYYRRAYVLVGSDGELEQLGATILERTNSDPLRKLLADWFQGELNQISEHGSGLDWQAAVDDAKARHETFGVPWDDAFVPDYVREMLAIMKDDE